VGPDRRVLAAFLGAVLFGGVNAIAVRQAVLELPPLWAMAARFLAAGILMTVLTLVLRRPFPRGRSLWGAALYGAIGFFGGFAPVASGLRSVPGGTGAVLIASSPLLTFALAVGQRQEPFKVRGLAGALVAVVGLAIVFEDQLSAAVPIGALLLILLGALAISESSIVLKAVPRSDPFASNAVAMLAGGGLLLAASLLTGETPAVPTRTSTWLAEGYLVVFGSVVLFSLFVYVIQHWTASAASYATLLFPFVGITVATLLTGETFDWSFVAGGAVMLLGVYVGAFQARPHRSSATSAPECLPIDECAEATAKPATPAPARA
jgi:drug/metabolite transporter (DMT)-like permease